MSRVLFLNGGLYSHVVATFPLVKSLTEQGEAVTYFCSEPYRKQIVASGAIFEPYEVEFHNLSGQGGFNYLTGILNQSIDKLIPRVLNYAQSHHIDYIIHDSIFGCGKLLGELLGLPRVTSITTLISETLIPEFKSSFAINSKEDYQNIRNYLNITKKLYHKYNLYFGPITNLGYSTGSLNIVYTSSYFQPDSDRLSNAFVFVGPIIYERNDNLGEICFERFANQKVIYISLGTVYNTDLQLFQFFIDVFQNYEGFIIISVGYHLDISMLKNIPANIIIKKFVPQLDVLKRADLFITHGGMNSVQEAMYFSVPLIVIPQDADQPLVANRVKELGAGIYLSKSLLTGEKLMQAVTEIFTNLHYKSNAERISNSYQESGGIAKAVAAIGKWKHEQMIGNFTEKFLGV
jgi:MGT family glycosyltransferase